LPAPLLSIPTVLGPVVMAYKLPDLEVELILSGDVIAGIYLGEITTQVALHTAAGSVAPPGPEGCERGSLTLVLFPDASSWGATVA
jgi:hypothetical protein